jgi:hypothetical protein
MIYLLTRSATTKYDEYDAKIVRASSEQEARILANESTGDDGKIWTDPKCVTCEPCQPDGASGVLLASFNAG